MLVRQAETIVGKTSRPGKMPCRTYSLPALVACPVGCKLVRFENSVCAMCYATKGRYQMTRSKLAQHRRLWILEIAQKKDYLSQLWIEAMATISDRKPVFRWHDSGDVYNQLYFDMILSVVKLTPNTLHWIPTKEIDLMVKNEKYITDLKNLVVRISEYTISTYRKISHKFLSSSIESGKGYKCTAYEREGTCGNCRACWNKNILNIDYAIH